MKRGKIKISLLSIMCLCLLIKGQIGILAIEDDVDSSNEIIVEDHQEEIVEKGETISDDVSFEEETVVIIDEEESSTEELVEENIESEEEIVDAPGNGYSLQAYKAAGLRIENFSNIFYGDIDYFIVDNNVVFCIEPEKDWNWYATEQNQGQSVFNNLSRAIKREVARIMSIGMQKYSESRVQEWLWATQLHVWSAIKPGGYNLSGSSTYLQPYLDTIQHELNTFETIPSFANADRIEVSTSTLQWNFETNRYEVMLNDTNGVLDSKFKEMFGKTIGDYRLEDGEGSNNLLVSTTNHNAAPSNVNDSRITHTPFNAGYARFFDAGQDLATIGADPINSYVIFNVEPKKGVITLKKQGEALDNSNTYIDLAAVEFGIYKDTNNNQLIDEEESEVVDTLITDEFGNAVSSELYYGNYLIKELSVDSHYVLSDTIYPITVNSDTQAINNGEAIINNTIKGQIILSKKGYSLDNSHILLPLEGVSFAVYHDINSNEIIDRQESKPIDIITTDIEGNGVSIDLSIGDYLVQEVKPLEGYQRLETIYPVSITENNSYVSINNGEALINEVIMGKIGILKHGIDNDRSKPSYPLSGVSFAVYHYINYNGIIDRQEGKPIDMLTSDSQGKAITNVELVYGQYIVKELKTQNGYIKDSTEYIVNIVENNQLVMVNNGEAIINLEVPPLPDTGSDDGVEIALGVLAAVLCVLVIRKVGKNAHLKENK
ncbi:MAG: collagen binding domain-containing protein [Erysipelotrichaceae bacterium]